VARGPKVDPELESGIETAMEIFAPLGPLAVRKMFGGAGVYLDGRMFALIANSDIYLKSDDVSLGRYMAAGCAPFVFQPKDGKAIAMSYRKIPDSALDDMEEALEWGKLALEAAARGKR
jgi:DNA transformation protein and related proteins